MKILKILVGIVLVIACVFFLGAYLLPARVTVERQVDLDRPAAMVFAVANDLSRFNEWSPWYALDPSATYRFEGPVSGAGAVMHWSGNTAVGTGSMRIISSDAPTRIDMQVAFEGFDPPADTGYLIESTSDATSRMTWRFDVALSGPTARWFGLVMPGHIGADYEKGLGQFKVLVASLPAEDFSELAVTEQDVPAIDIIAIAGSAPVDDMAASAAVLGELYGRLIAFAVERAIDIPGPPLTLTDELDGDVWRFRAALPVRDGSAIQAAAPVEVARTTAGRALVVEHVGAYDGLAATLDKLDAYARAHGHRRAGAVQRIYVSDPADTPVDALVTRIVFPITVE
jgi:effector-binding domain-containing protein